MSDDKHLDQKYKTLDYCNEQFDKSIVFIASGAFGISFAFIDKIVPLKTALIKEYLINSWYIYSIVVFVSLAAHFVGAMANRWAISAEENDSYNLKVKIWNWSIRSMNIAMIAGLLYGSVLLIQFIKYNLLFNQ